MNVTANNILDKLFMGHPVLTSAMTLLAALDDGRGLVWLVSTCEAVQPGVP
jgi:hypothetical protein